MTLDTTKVIFEYQEKQYTFRPWFGSYCLIPGAENGIYEDNGAWDTNVLGLEDAAKDQKIYMNIQLYDRSGNLIMSTYDHGQERYWQFGSNPMAGVQDKSNMYMEATLSSDEQDFLQALANGENQEGEIKFGDVTPVRNAKGEIHYDVTYTYDPNGILNNQNLGDAYSDDGCAGGGYAGGGHGGGAGSAW